MSELKRIPVKYIRDYMKKHYKLRDLCYICNSNHLLELHHIYSVSDLFMQWCTKNKIPDINTVSEMEDVRTRFVTDEAERLSNDYLFTLCKKHHELLHSIYGQNYTSVVAPKVLRWMEIQKTKHAGKL